VTPKPRKPPAFVTPMAAVTVKKLPEGDEWLYELKWDGYRALLIKDGEDVQIRCTTNCAKPASDRLQRKRAATTAASPVIISAAQTRGGPVRECAMRPRIDRLPDHWRVRDHCIVNVVFALGQSNCILPVRVTLIAPSVTVNPG
jgi:hypothetical protein